MTKLKRSIMIGLTFYGNSNLNYVKVDIHSWISVFKVMSALNLDMIGTRKNCDNCSSLNAYSINDCDSNS